jgi:hypothetical protein
MEEHKTLFRTKAMDRIASPDQLTEYLRVTNPGIWAVLAAVILLLAGIFAWSMVGTLETTADVTAVVEDHEARIVFQLRDSSEWNGIISVIRMMQGLFRSCRKKK